MRTLVALVVSLSFAATLSGPVAATESPAPATIVHIKGFMFVPASLTVHAGDSVTFVNDDDEAHTVTARDSSFHSPGLDSNQRWQHVFAKTGTFAYFCELHAYMKATIVVLPADKQL